MPQFQYDQQITQLSLKLIQRENASESADSKATSESKTTSESANGTHMGKYSELTTFTEGIVQFSKQLGEPPSFSLTKLEDGIATVSDNVPAAADSSRSLIDKKLMPISEETKSSAAEVLGNKVPNNQCKLFTLSYTTYSSSDSNDNY